MRIRLFFENGWYVFETFDFGYLLMSQIRQQVFSQQNQNNWERILPSAPKAFHVSYHIPLQNDVHVDPDSDNPVDG